MSRTISKWQHDISGIDRLCWVSSYGSTIRTRVLVHGAKLDNNVACCAGLDQGAIEPGRELPGEPGRGRPGEEEEEDTTTSSTWNVWLAARRGHQVLPEALIV